MGEGSPRTTWPWFGKGSSQFSKTRPTKFDGTSTLGLQRERRKLEKQPSHTMVSGAYDLSSCPSLVLY